MTQDADARLPLRFGTLDRAGPETALLIEGDAPAPAGVAVARFALPIGFPRHAIGCACCAPRGPAAEALGRLFLARARGGIWFREVLAVASPAGQAAVRAALAEDVVTAARFRVAD